MSGRASEARASGAGTGRGRPRTGTARRAQDGVAVRGAATSRAGAARRAAALRRLSVSELVEVFRGLEAPALEELDGEYRATLLDQGGALWNAAAALATTLPAAWLGKAFEALGPNEGHGYNFFRGRHGETRRYRMRTRVEASRVDGRPAYVLDYAGLNRGYMGTMRDELRRVEHGLYLGIGGAGFTEAMRRRPLPFLLEGPPDPFVR